MPEVENNPKIYLCDCCGEKPYEVLRNGETGLLRVCRGCTYKDGSIPEGAVNPYTIMDGKSKVKIIEVW